MKQNNRKIGKIYEQAVGEILQENGYQIIEYNYRCPRGEIDLIACEGGYLVFCEVKFRKNELSGHPLEAVDNKKQRIISKCALYYITSHYIQDVPCRFDVIGVLGEKVSIVQNAFTFLS